MSFRLRRAHPREAEDLTALARRAKASWGYPVDWLREWADDLTITPQYVARHHVLVADTADGVVGVAALELGGEDASLEHVWVDPGRQGQGVGAALVRRALETAAGLGCAGVVVVSDPHARAFYEHLGARPAGTLAAPMPGAPDRVLPVLRFALAGR